MPGVVLSAAPGRPHGTTLPAAAPLTCRLPIGIAIRSAGTRSGGIAPGARTVTFAAGVTLPMRIG